MYREQVDELQRIYSIFDHFFKMERWTPAMAAMLVSGAVPLRGAQEIPKQAASLRSLSTPATVRVLRRAQEVLDDWIDWHSEEPDELTSGALAGMSPTDFFEWCLDVYNSRSGFRPEWLDHWQGFTGIHDLHEPPPPIPGALISHTKELETFASVVTAGTPGTVALPIQKECQGIAVQLAARLRADNSGARSPIRLEIADAVLAAGDPVEPTRVWIKLREIAKGGSLVVKYINDRELKVPGSGGEWAKFDLARLRQYIQRHVARLRTVS